jgi:hypothetical protein
MDVKKMTDDMKKPWEYSTLEDKLHSVIEFKEDKEVLRKALLDEPDKRVKVVALYSLIEIEPKLNLNDAFVLLKYLTDLGFSTPEASELLVFLDESMKQTREYKKSKMQ